MTNRSNIFLRVLSRLAILFSLVLIFSACNKPALYGTVQESDSITQNFKAPPPAAFEAAKHALVYLGYSLKQENPEQGILETYWQPTKAGSHYVSVFGRRDYGTVGAYYQLRVKVRPRGEGSAVSVANISKSFISNLKSAEREEREFLSKVDDFTRKDIQVTNIGPQ